MHSTSTTTRNVLRNLGCAAVAVGILVGSPGIPAASAQSACAFLGGIVDAPQSCHVHSGTDSYQLDFRFPVDYPDQQAVADYLAHERDAFRDWVAQSPPSGSGLPYTLDITGRAYHSAGTQSLVLTIGNGTGVHPVTYFEVFNYDVGTHAPITFDTFFTSGPEALEVLNPIVERELKQRGHEVDDISLRDYQNFAIADDAVTFFFNQDGLLPHVDGPLRITVPRADLASVLA